ncbi:hypothetical protein KGA66_26860 [Actinocrinis puniceicyclus]|uniref:Uncharacterized protein n=1 Tax=Actinocrinis puniceicyclus TaxID=977794 RepID=A0A8J7WUG7_9ACTN|nr:hypothetical protein [Actinocrinis puniceicyclus]MBS2966687.1 hypothetical protein [Actinocrinis puniceicyclus]
MDELGGADSQIWHFYIGNEIPLTWAGWWPAPGGASLGITNVKPAVFSTVAKAFPGQFKGAQWSDLAMNDSLDLKVTAYYLKYLSNKYLPTASSGTSLNYTQTGSCRAGMTQTQVLEGIYNGGEPNYVNKVIPNGGFGPQVSNYIDTVSFYYGQAEADLNYSYPAFGTSV